MFARTSAPTFKQEFFTIMTPEGILDNDDLAFDSALGARVVRMLHAKEVVELHRARERQLRLAAQQEERRRFGDGACVTMSLDPVIAMRLLKDPRFGDKSFGEKEFKKDMKKWHPEFLVKTRHQTKHFAIGGLQKQKQPDKDAKYLVAI